MEATSDKIRECLSVSKLGFNPSMVNTDGSIDMGVVRVHFQEWIDNSEGYDWRLTFKGVRFAKYELTS